MLNRFLITNRPDIRSDLPRVADNGRFALFAEGGIRTFGETVVFIDGFVTPRDSLAGKTVSSDPHRLVCDLFRERGADFIDHVKGAFIIVIHQGKEFFVFNDHQSQKKFFIHESDRAFLLSNHLKIVTDRVRPALDRSHAALFCLMEHFIDGTTMFEGIRYSRPATAVRLTDCPRFSRYWGPERLSSLDRGRRTFDEMAEGWSGIIGRCIGTLSPSGISMTLTGGNDTRMILAALLHLGIRPDTFSFGDPGSFDGVIAAELARSQKLGYHNYFVDEPTSGWFREKADLIIEMGNTLVNIHRAHRLEAIEREADANPRNRMILGGFMGGDYIKGIVYDDYITPKLVRRLEYTREDRAAVVSRLLRENYLIPDRLDFDVILDLLNQQEFIRKRVKIEREFHFVAEVVGAIHDVQDISLFQSKMPLAYNPYMDVDFLTLLFSSEYSMLHKNNPTRNQLARIRQPELQIRVTHTLAPELSRIPFSKKGYYTADEYLGNKAFYFVKRLVRSRTGRKYPPSFPYRGWMAEFVEREIEDLDPKLSEFVDVKRLENDLRKNRYATIEGYWHPFTNILNLNMNIRHHIR